MDSDDDGLDPSRNVTKVGIAGVTFDLGGVRVDRKHVVATLPQSSVHDVAAVIFGMADSGKRRSRRCACS
jgi:hypothetical protein